MFLSRHCSGLIDPSEFSAVDCLYCRVVCVSDDQGKIVSRNQMARGQDDTRIDESLHFFFHIQCARARAGQL